MTATNRKEIRNALTDLAEHVVDGLHRSPVPISAEEAPSTLQSKLFIVEIRDETNSRKYRERRGGNERTDARAVYTILHRVRTGQVGATQDDRDDDVNALRQAILADTEVPTRYLRPEHVRTVARVHASLEWLITEVEFTLEFDFELPADA